MITRFRTLPVRIAAATIVTGMGVTLAVNFPGHLSYDSQVQLLEGRQGAYANWHPALMSWLLGSLDGIYPGTGLFVALDVLLLFGSLLALMALPVRSSWAMPLAAFLCVVSPQFLLYPGIVWKDILFAALAIAGFVSLAHAATQWRNLLRRLLLCALCFFLLAAALLIRQNGAVVLPAAAVALGWITARHDSLRRGLIWGVVALAVGFCAALTIRMALETRIHGNFGPATQISQLQRYDIVGALKAAPDFKLDLLTAADPGLGSELRASGIALYTPQRFDTLSDSKNLQSALDRVSPAAISAQWIDLVFHHTTLYFKVRLEVFRWMFAPPEPQACLPYQTGIDGPPGVLRALGLAERRDARDQLLGRYAAAITGTPLFSHASAALLLMLEFALLLLRGRDTDLAIAAMLGGAMAFVLSFFVIALACDHRYLYFADAAAMVGFFYLVLDIPGWNRMRKWLRS